jgi:hypothetical protein
MQAKTRNEGDAGCDGGGGGGRAEAEFVFMRL